MPMKPRRPCRVLACPGLNEINSRYCKAHQDREAEDEAKRQRGYDRFARDPAEVKFYHSKTWLDLRGWVLTRYPLCTICGAAGKVVAATEVDHIIPRKDGGPDSMDNLQGLCGDCHKTKTSQDVRQRKVAANG